MAMKALLFLLAFMVLVSIRVSSVEEEFTAEYHAPAPKGLPVVCAPQEAPAPSPPALPPAPLLPGKQRLPPPPAPAPAPAPLLPGGQRLPRVPGCSGKCVKYCDAGPQKKWCQRVCTVCCSEYKCVPGIETSCNNWNQVYYHGQLVKCP